MTAGNSLDGRIGIFQGRLVESASGALQCHPGTRWREEFDTAARIGFAYIELLAERVHDAADPIWTSDGRAAVRDAAMETGLALVSMCIEEPLEHSLGDLEVANEVGRRLAAVVGELQLRTVVLPLFEASQPDPDVWDALARSVHHLGAMVGPAGAHLALELPLRAPDSLRFLEAVASPHASVCYDVGNATASGFDPAVEINFLGSNIGHVHAKDRDADGQNVRFGEGRVDFEAAFAALVGIGYAGDVTIEATRGDDPAVTASEHLSFLLSLRRATRPALP